MSIHLEYESGKVQGWAGPELAAEAWNMLRYSDSFKPMFAMAPVAEKRKVMLYEFVRKLLGKDTPNYPQKRGSCVSFGAKNAIEHVSCTEIVLNGDAEKFRPIFAPYLYGTGRVLVGKGRLNGSDGSLGSWQAEAVIKYGTIASDDEDVPEYSGNIEWVWGNTPGPPTKFVELGKKHLIKSAAKINSWGELVNAICSGFPCTVASNQGFTMLPDQSGFHRASGSWGHQMCIIGIDETYTEDYAIILNSWGDVMGKLVDFKTNEPLPVGCIRAKRSVIESMIRAGETFAYSAFDGFEDRSAVIEKALFKMS